MAITTTVRGTITATSSGNPISDLTIQIWEDKNGTVLKTVQTDPDGKYTAILKAIPIEARLYVNIYKHDFELLDNSNNKFTYAAGTTYTKDYNVEIPMDVTGTLLTHDGDTQNSAEQNIVQNKTVKLFAKTFGSEQLLNETTTDEKGIYNLHYYQDPATTRLDFLVEVYFSGAEKPDFISDLQIDVKENLKIDFLVTGDKYIGVTKVTDTIDKIDSVVRSANPGSLTDEDVKILTLDNDIDTDTAKKYIRAKQLFIDMNVKSPNITKEVLFGLMQKGISFEPAIMLIQDKNILYNTIIDAVDSNIINSGEDPGNSITKEQWAENVTNDLKLLAVSLAENKTSGEAGKFTLFNVIQDIPEAKRDDFLNKYVLNTKSDDEFWRDIVNESTLDSAEIEKVKFNLDLSLFSDQHEPAFTELHSFSSTNNINTLKELAENNIDWRASITGNLVTSEMPDFIEGDTLSDKRDQYAKYFEDKIAEKFPSEVIIADIKANKDTSFGRLTTFFNDNTNFKFGETTVETYITENNLTVDEDTKNELKQAQRLFNILPSKDKVSSFNLLWSNEIKSAHSIILLGEIEFTKLFESSEVSSEVVKELFLKAQNKNSKATEIFSKYNNRTNATDAHVLPDRPDSDNPDLETLFKSFDYCDCIDCRSTLSPAAYLTDNLAFLRQIKTIDSSTVFDKLIERRPDIEKTLLSCKNTDTPIPYIDIVNEVLESAVSQEPDITEYQTDWKSDEIDANPEHFNSSAYSTLKTSKSPLSLPFNYWNEEAKAFLSHFNLKLSDIIELFPDAQDSDLNSAITYLGMSVEDKDFLITSDYYIYSKNTITDILKDTQLEYDEFTDLLRSIYINPDNKETTYDEDCSLTGATINFTEAEFKKFFNFKRLLNITGWTLEELDKIIVWRNNSINDDFIQLIATIRKIQDLTKVSVEELLTWWNTIDTVTHINSENSFYKNKFLNRTLETGETSIFKLDETGEIEDKETKIITEKISDIASVVNLSEKEIIKLTSEGDKLDIQNLSYLNRISVFSKAIRITAKENNALSSMTGINAVNNIDNSADVNPEDTLKFIDILEKVKKSGFTINDLEYLLNNNEDVDSELIVKLEDKTEFLEKLQTELNLLKTDYVTGKYDKETLLKDVLKSINISDIDIEDTIKVINNTYIAHDPDNWTILQFISNHTDDIFKGTNENPDPTLILTGENPYTEVDKRFQYVLNGLTQDIYNFIFKEKVISCFINEFGLDMDFIEEILSNFVKTGVAPNQVSALFTYTHEDFLSDDLTDYLSDFYTIYETINKATAFIKNYDISLTEYKASIKNTEIINIFNITPNFNEWENLDSAYDLQIKYFDKSEYMIFDFFADNYSGIKSDLLEVAGWFEDDFDFIINANTLTIELLHRASELLEISKNIGLSPETLSSWTNLLNINTTSETIKSAVKAKYDTETWKTVAKPIMNNLREKRRDVLSTYLINYGYIREDIDTVHYQDTNELYEYFLLDTEMSSCAKTSRIVLANSVMQLFVQRIQMNLEGSELTLDDDQAKEWTWRKKYRVWEANRKVFLYPENWLEPELRDDKSPFFKEMEEELLQVDLDADSVESIYKNYLEKLDEVAKLEIAQHYFDEETGDLHVFARTFSTPNIYYYRKRNSMKKWTAWEKLDLEISGKIIMPVVYNNTLYLFWVKYIPIKSDDGNKMADVHIMWSEYKHNRWLSGKMSEEAFRRAHLDFVNETKRYYFIEKSEDGIFINTVISRGGENDYILENYEFKLKFNLSEKTFEKIDTGTRTFINNVNKSGLSKYYNGKYYFNKNNQLSLLNNGEIIIGDSNDYWDSEIWDAGMNRPILTNEPNVDYRITLPHQEKFYKSENPFFFEDAKHTFLVVPNETFETFKKEEGQIIPQEAKPIRCQTNSLTNVIKSSIPVYESAIDFNKPDDTDNEIDNPSLVKNN